MDLAPTTLARLNLAFLLLLTAACEQAPPPSQPIEDAYAEAMGAPIRQDALPITDLFEKPGRYAILSEIRDVKTEGLAPTNARFAENHYRSLGKVPIEFCVSQEQIDGGVSAIIQMIAVPGCEVEAQVGQNGRARSGTACPVPEGMTYHLAETTDTPGGARVTELKPDGRQGYVIVDWSVDIAYRGACGAE